MPHSVAVSVPLLVMPPANLPTCCSKMSVPCTEIVPLLAIPPPTLSAPKEPTLWTRIAQFRAEIVPAVADAGGEGRDVRKYEAPYLPPRMRPLLTIAPAKVLALSI